MHFSSASFKSELNQKKRHLNPEVERLLASCMSMRRIARLLEIHLNTVARKKKFLGLEAMRFNQALIRSLSRDELMEIQFDDLVTFEHTKLKQVSVPVIVTRKNRKIIGIDACRIPTSGVNAKLALKKYGVRPNEHPETLHSLFASLKEIVPQSASFTSDSKSNYGSILKKSFPAALHTRVQGQRGCVVGQGELKKIAFDPLFSLNHTCAMLRANMSRLVRRTCCTTKKMEPLRWHLAIYTKYHNQVLTPQL